MKRTQAIIWTGVVALTTLEYAHAQLAEPGICEDLQGLEVPAVAIRHPVGPVSFDSAVSVPAQPPTTAENGDIVLEIAAHCRVQGAIAPVDGDAPPINFNINLPFEWNGKLLQSGGGGLGGNVNTSPGRKASGWFDPQPVTDTYPLTEGYMTFGGDEGHQGGAVEFIYNEEALRNWGYASFIKVRDVAVWLAEEAYGREPERVYFSGESAGGREALMMSQRYPDAYDGIIAVTPVLSWNYTHIADNNIRSKLIDGWLDSDDIAFIAERTREFCDADDGLEDGVLARYMDCRMDSQTLRCPSGAEGEGCLSDEQIAAVDAIRYPWSMSVTLANDVVRFPGYGVTGDEDRDENQWGFYMVGSTPPTYPLPPGRGFQSGNGAILNFAGVWIRHAIAQQDDFEPHGFYPPAFADRIQYLSNLFDATDPNLSGLRDSGGKLLILQQSADNAVSTTMLAEYYRSIIGRMGSDAAGDVVRLYIGPGGTHNGSGVAQVDMLGLLEAWVEDGEAPPDEIPAHLFDRSTHERLRSMVACVYPAYARYGGNGDVNESSSYSCTDRHDPLEYRTVTQ